jgi:hypothetical protein
MTKKPKRDRSVMDVVNKLSDPPQSTEPVVLVNIGNYLERVRNEALERHGHVIAEARDAAHNTERTIADLEDWRDEITATIAFLKATRR